MSASNYNWVCFNCRYVKRESKASTYIPACMYCKNDLYCLGYKVSVPKRSKVKEWKFIQKNSYCRDMDFISSEAKAKVRRKHNIEKEIERLSLLLDSKENRKQIKKLRKLLVSGNYIGYFL